MKICEFYIVKYLRETYPRWNFEIKERSEHQFKVATAIGDFIISRYPRRDNSFHFAVTTKDTPKIYAENLEDLGKSFQRSINFQLMLNKVNEDYMEIKLK